MARDFQKSGSQNRENGTQPSISKVVNKALEKLKGRVRETTRRTRGRNIGVIVAELRETLLGWKVYFGIAEVLSSLREIFVRDAWNTSKSAHGEYQRRQH